MKLLFTLFCFSSFVFALSIEKLQEDFLNDVIETNIYKTQFKSFLSKECTWTDEACIKKSIERLKTWESTKSNDYLYHKINERSHQVLLSPIQAKKIKQHLYGFIQTHDIKESQFITLVHLKLQRLSLTFYDAKRKEVFIIGTDLISTGNMQREKEVTLGEDHYFKTPTGVFENLRGWRSNGKYNASKKSLAYGQKERFVFYFGKQQSIRYNTFDKNKKKLHNPKDWQLITDYLEFAMHSHESKQTMGTPNSHGCIRITHELNLFLDEILALHANNLKKHQWINNSKAPSGYKQKSHSGKYLLVIDRI